ncbi:uncharacterized protein BJX67DRAFT_384154 [Aspergillus lucknowensis]|uniref:Uncharacterized protein n=1 Tax=Aspergillus lucknowensis TaxID=176173 RepID=A0ABR4LHE4_9EURO
MSSHSHEEKVPEQTPTLPNRILLVGPPIIAHDFVFPMLNLPQQPNVIEVQAKFYSFLRRAHSKTIYRAHVKSNTSPESWTYDEKQSIKAAFQHDFDKLDNHAVKAEASGKTLVAHTVSTWLVNPAAQFRKPYVANPESQRALEAFFRVDVPREYAHRHPVPEHPFWLVNPASLLENRPARVGSAIRSGQLDAYRINPSEGGGGGGGSASQRGFFSFSPFNETVIADQYLRTWRMVLVIQHPVFSFYEVARTRIVQLALQKATINAWELQNILGAETTFRWTRMLYDFCVSQSTSGMAAPLIVDIGDVVRSPEEMLARLCRELGLDYGVAKPRVCDAHLETDRTLHPSRLAVYDLIREGKIGLDDLIAGESQRWVRDFGPRPARITETLVREGMSDYEYLYARRMQ